MMRQLLVDLYQHGGRFTTGPRTVRDIRKAYGTHNVTRALRLNLVEVWSDTLYLTPAAIDLIWED